MESTARSIAEMARREASRRRIPRATYRLQFGPSFSFREGREVVSYLDDLGISDCYASPLFKPCFPDSHGYDVCDPNELNPAIGTRDEFEGFTAELASRGLGLLLDLVPNHMGISTGNLWWDDVLENGPSSQFARYFDIDWQPVKPELDGKVLLPILEDQYGKALEEGKLRLAFEEGAFCIYSGPLRLPVAPRTYTPILSRALQELSQAMDPGAPPLQELQSILTALSYLPGRKEKDREKLAERNREKEVIKRRIAALDRHNPQVRKAIEATVRAFNGVPGDARSFDLLGDLLDGQAYRPAFWRVAADEINYRRFFDVNGLAAIRVEFPEVFRETHRLVFQLLLEGKVTGLRIDHPDGLWDAAAYFQNLQDSFLLNLIRERLGPAAPEADLKEAAGSWRNSRFDTGGSSPLNPPLYVVAEKVLLRGEMLPREWEVCGNTGYDFLNALNGLFVAEASRQAFDIIYSRFIGTTIDYENLINSTRKMIMLVSLASEINALSHKLERLAERNRYYRDFTLNSLTFAIREVIACLPVYRTYISGPEAIAPRDRSAIESAVEKARKRNPRTAQAIFQFLQGTLLFGNIADFPEEARPELITFVKKFQQVTGPVMAKGVEDTAFYIYNRLVSLNEVGGYPDQFGLPLGFFHRQNAERQAQWPHSLLATSTHDTKRSEDVRARLNVLSEIPGEWRAALDRWSRLNARRKILVDGEPAPHRNDEYLLYQTLVGACPTAPFTAEEFDRFRERIATYMHKATREAKVITSWVNPHEAYEAAVREFIQRVLDGSGKNRFLVDFLSFHRRVDFFARFNSLGQLLLKMTSPGVPDTYQGTEVWDFSLVDPDNRRPVDFARLKAMLKEVQQKVSHFGQDVVPFVEELLQSSGDGRIKLYLTWRALQFRRTHPQLFAEGFYQPLEGLGEKSHHLCAFARVGRGKAVLTVAPRLVAWLTGGEERPPLGDVWQDTWLMLPRDWGAPACRNFLTGESLTVQSRGELHGLPLAAVLRHFPVALLECQGSFP